MHGPMGYKSYDKYRPWLRDEFLFRCVYCLNRERWTRFLAGWDIDHFIPQKTSNSGVLDYGNLLLSCHTCNAAKRDQQVPNPCECMLANSAVVDEKGVITAKTADAARVIRKLGLDSRESTEFRRLFIDNVALALKYDPQLHKQLMGFPTELPNLARLRPKDNSRPDGIAASCFELRNRSLLRDTY
jgi:hypothetical protein